MFLFQGLVGLLLFLALYWLIWRRLLVQVQQSASAFTLGLACFVSSFLAAGLLNILNWQWWGIVLALSFVALRPQSTEAA